MDLRGDERALNDALNFPHVRLASGHVTTWETRGSDRLADFLARAGVGWHESRWDERNIIQAGADKVHLAVEFSRWRRLPLDSFTEDGDNLSAFGRSSQRRSGPGDTPPRGVTGNELA